MHTKGKLNGYNMGATVQLCIGDVVVANTPAVDGVNHIDNAKRLALTWNSHDALLEAVEILLAACKESIPEFNIPKVNDILKAAKGEYIMNQCDNLNAQSRIRQEIAHAQLLRGNAQTQSEIWNLDSEIRHQQHRLDEMQDSYDKYNKPAQSIKFGE